MLPIGLIIVVLVILAMRRQFEILSTASVEQLQSQASLAALDIEVQNNSAVLSVQRMAEAQVAGMFGDRQASLNYARLVLENSPGITAAYFGYEPNADGNDAEISDSLPAKATSEAGRFIPYWFRAPTKGNAIELEPLVDMESSLYYQGARDAFVQTKKASPMVTEPYVYQGKMIVEQTYPIVIDGKFMGVAGVDRALTELAAELRQLSEQQQVDLFLVSSRGKFIAATTDPRDDNTTVDTGLKTKEVSKTDYRDLFQPWLERVPDTIPETQQDPTDKEMYYFAVARIPTGGWTLILRQSGEATLAPVWAELRTRIGLAAGGMVLIFSLLSTMAYRLSRRVNLAARAAERIAAGDLTEELQCDASPDETGILLRSVKTMTENLNRLVGNVKRASIQLNSTATELAATSRQQESTASSFGASASQIAAAVKQISATSSELVETMDQVSVVANETAKLATNGRTSLNDMESKMRGLDEATESIGDKLSVINEKAANITGIVTTITKVADQTNLLSVNAAIEAEKAGEYGVGFLVVAREIRRLADQTGGATLDIEQMVQQMHSAVSAGVMEMDRFTDQVRRIVKDVGGISQQMEEIIERVNANSASFERVNESMQSQSQGADQISSEMSQLTAHAQQTSEAIREYSQASDELQEAIGSLKSSISTFRLKSD